MQDDNEPAGPTTEPPAAAETSAEIAAAKVPPRGERGWVGGLLIALLIAFLGAVAFFGGAVVSAGFGLFETLRETRVETTIRPTPAVVKSVRELAQLQTTSFHMERVIDISDEQKRFWGYLSVKDAILLVAAADVTAGVDLSKLREEDVSADPDTLTVSLTLPPPEILTARLDNDRTYVHTRDTEMLARRDEKLEGRARKEAERTLRDAALDAGILERAKENAERSLRSLLVSFGYEKIEIRWR